MARKTTNKTDTKNKNQNTPKNKTGKTNTNTAKKSLAVVKNPVTGQYNWQFLNANQIPSGIINGDTIAITNNNTNTGTPEAIPGLGLEATSGVRQIMDLSDLNAGHYSGENSNSAFDQYMQAFGSYKTERESFYNYNSESVNTYIRPILTSGTIGGIFAMPYQFLPSVDRRIDVVNYSSSDPSELPQYSAFPTVDTMGRRYAEKVVSQLPLLFLTPCRARFMEGFNNDDKASIITSLINGGGLDDNNLSKSGRYYSTEIRCDEYYACVNLMCAEVAYFCGISNQQVTIGDYTGTIGDIDWYNVRNKSFNDYFYAKESVVLYVDGLTTVSDSFSNTTTESQIASSVNGFSEQAKELRFILGENSVITKLGNLTEESLATLGNELGNILASTTGGLLADLASTGVSTIMSGGKLLFPKIWGESSFSRSYSFDIKLRSPDHDTVSIFFNILVPYIHLLALCMPQGITEGKAQYSSNAYTAPFLLRAYSKGQFNINMGMITDMSVTRGGEAQWNDNGLPTQMDISITIEDLYNTLFMTNPNPNGNPLAKFSSLKRFFNIDVVANTEMLDFLANLAGLNVAGQELNRKTKMVEYLTMNQLKRTGSDIYHFFSNGITNIIRGFYE